MIEAGRRLLPVEVKSARRVRSGDARGLAAFLDEHRKAAPFGIVLYGGDEVHQLAERVVAVPIACLWG